MIYLRTINRATVAVKTPTEQQIATFLESNGWAFKNNTYSKTTKRCECSFRVPIKNEMALISTLRVIAYTESIEISDLLRQMIGSDYKVSSEVTHIIVTLKRGQQ